jgi:hypothetical protein
MFHVKRDDFASLSQKGWCSRDAFAAHVKDLAVGSGMTQAIVPALGDHDYLRIKVVDAAESQKLTGGVTVETVKSPCNQFTYHFGYEPEALDSPKSIGFTVSIWQKHPKVIANQLTYEFATGLLRVWGSGTTRSCSSKCGLQVFFKMSGRGSARPHPSGAVAEDDIWKQQYWNNTYGNDPMNAFLRKHVNILNSAVLEIGQEQQPQLMKLIHHNCSMGLVTTGSVPSFAPAKEYLTTCDPLFLKEEKARTKRRQDARANKKRKLLEALESQVSQLHASDEDNPCLASEDGEEDEDDTGHFGDVSDSDFDSDSDMPASLPSRPKYTRARLTTIKQTNNRASCIGVVISSHVDKRDRLTKDQVEAWKAKCQEKNWSYCKELLDHPMFCLPTTCAYQFVYNDAPDSPEFRSEFSVTAFFSMEGLGLAMPLQHGISHNFMGGAFAHHTSIPYRRCYHTKEISCSNADNRILIVGWGKTGGKKTVKNKTKTSS